MYEYYLDGREEGESLIKKYSFVDMVSLDFLLKISWDVFKSFQPKMKVIQIMNSCKKLKKSSIILEKRNNLRRKRRLTSLQRFNDVRGNYRTSKSSMGCVRDCDTCDYLVDL